MEGALGPELEAGSRLEQRRFFWIVWVPLFLATQFIALLIVFHFNPAGFDDCDATHLPPNADERAAAAVAVGIALLVSTPVAIWRLRRRYLAVALVVSALAGTVLWWAIFAAGPPCEPHPTTM